LPPKLSIYPKNLREFSAVLSKAGAKASDLRVPFGLIARSQFIFERAVFKLKSAGQYQDLSTKPFLARWTVKENPSLSWTFFPGGYKEYKEKVAGFVYPILLRTGRMARSLLTPGGENILRIGTKSLEMGTQVPYGIHHQFGTSRMPARPFLFIDDQRLGSWKRIINDHLKKSFVKFGTGSAKKRGDE